MHMHLIIKRDGIKKRYGMIKKQILIVLVILINILFSCNSKKQNIAYTLVIKDTISVILPENNFINIKNFDYFQENDSDYILLYFYSKSKLYLFNLTSKKFIKSIPIYPWFSTLHFKYINKDSILDIWRNNVSL